MKPKIYNEFDNQMILEIKNYFYYEHLHNGGTQYDFEFKIEDNPSLKNFIFANIKLYGEKSTKKYIIKSYTLLNCKEFPNLKKLFIYKLFELLKISPSVQFIFSESGTKMYVIII